MAYMKFIIAKNAVIGKKFLLKRKYNPGLQLSVFDVTFF